VAAVQLARLAGESLLTTALGEDEHGRKAVERLGELGVEVHAARRAGSPTRTAVTLVDDGGERTITTFGSRLEALGDDDLPWDSLAEMDAIYFTAGDLDALRAARAARVLVASPRALDALGHGVPLDALVLSASDAIEREESDRALADAELVLYTEGERGGSYRVREGKASRWTAATAPGPVVDSYGCGDSFAAGLTYGLGAGLPLPDALELAARCGAMCLSGRGPYTRQLTATRDNEGPS
jgi:ribokinase